MKYYFTLLIIIISIFSLTSFQTRTNSSSESKGIEFFKGTYAEALLKAKEENKYVFVDFYATWCGNCKQLKKSFKDKEVGIYYNKNFINISINGETKEGRELMHLYQIQSYPTLLIVDFKGKVLTKSTGVLKPYILINFGRRIVP
ncbi:thioredoxin family protein [Flavobacterium tegetincola]|uniref:thioredoxin family protein n=1 Tax=Flavobacterium tegetincola TaxID=150172 RepID=UPI0003F8EE19|nr:thioredoxin family protein [Flavobacterium tegetincola]